jgi:hypothetical protein
MDRVLLNVASIAPHRWEARGRCKIALFARARWRACHAGYEGAYHVPWGAVRRSSRKKLFAPEGVAKILDRAGESRFSRACPPIAASVWRDAVGARIAERAQPISLWNGILVLRTATSVWAHELSFLTDDICGRLRERGVEVRQLRFHVGPISAVERPAERRIARTVPKAHALPSDLAGLLANLSDTALRAAIARAAESNLAWQSVVRPAIGPLTGGQRAVRAPRSAEAENAPPDRAPPVFRGGPPSTTSSGRDRSR